MNLKIIIASVVVVAAIIFGALSFIETNVEYTNFGAAANSRKKVQVKGEWVKDKQSTFDSKLSKFSFYMKDDSGREEKVIYNGAKPNNFEIANSIVVKGRYQEGAFHASEILTKCPSKYEGVSPTPAKAMQQ